MKPIVFTVLAMGSVCTAACGWLPTQESSKISSAGSPRKALPTSDTPAATVFVGQSLDDAAATLHNAGIEHYVGGFSEAYIRGPDEDPAEVDRMLKDRSNMTFDLHDDRVTTSVEYSKSKGMVTRIRLLIVPYAGAPKSYQTWLGATELMIHADQSYSVRFAGPPTEEEKEESRRRFEYFTEGYRQ